MASISTDASGNRSIQFAGPDKRRRTIRLGKAPLRFVRNVKLHVEQLAAAAMTGHAVDDNTARWVAERGEAMTDKLAAVGLIPKQERLTLAAFIDAYTESTINLIQRPRKNSRENFPAD